jgi:alkanesulfonate monooxygenase SsuD/methylene tetrahydromethanopterin reductase-like flavin-dependent oxidoreductase (luciferase family)
MPIEFEMAGIPFERGSVRFERLAETAQIANMAFDGKTFSFEGTHYQGSSDFSGV